MDPALKMLQISLHSLDTVVGKTALDVEYNSHTSHQVPLGTWHQK